MRYRRRRTRHTEQAELNITAFLNLMVILVPFLLITAVFSRITILDLYIPSASENDTPKQQEQKEKPLNIKITIRDDSLSVSDNRQGLIKRIAASEGGYDFAALSELLQLMKEKVPDKKDATILVEPDIPYDTLVATMDAVRVVEIGSGADRVQAELFPDISIGDAPKRKN